MAPKDDLENGSGACFNDLDDSQNETELTTSTGFEDQGDQQTEQAPNTKLAWRDRIKHFTWTWFTMNMATGGLANVLYSIPLRFSGLETIGRIFLVFNLVLFLINCVLITLRFKFHSGTFKASFLHPTESLFAPAPIISICVILINITEFGVDDNRAGGAWLTHTVQILYWVYVAIAFTYSVGIYLLIWSTQQHTIAQMTPVWIFPIYPLLLVGPFANALTRPPNGLTGNHAVQIISGALVVQGAGFMVSLMVYSAFLYRLMSQKLPVESSRPALFVSVGPSAFTVSGIINISHNLGPNLSPDFMGNGALAGQVIKILGNCFGIWIWGLAIFFFMVSVGAHWNTISRGRIKFASTFWSFIFPNSALCTGTIAVARALDNNRAIEILSCVMAAFLVAAWVLIFILMIRAVILKDVLWPETSEDKQADLVQGSHSGGHHQLKTPLQLKKTLDIVIPQSKLALKRRITGQCRAS